MKILNVCKFDYAGCAWDLTRALQRNTRHEVRHVAMSEHEWGFGSDIVTACPKELRKWIKWADIVNCWGGFRPLVTAGFPKPRNLIMLELSSGYSGQIKAYRQSCREHGVKMVLHGNCHQARWADAWLPIAIPVDELASMKKGPGPKPVVCQTPSNLRRKSTEKIVELLGDMPHIELLIVHGVSNRAALEAKAGADIFIDHFAGLKVADFIAPGGHGKSSLEAWAMGIPVIAYASEGRREACREVIGYLPYYESTLDDLPKAVEALLDETVYAEYQERGQRYIRTFHDDPVVARKYMEICHGII